MHGATARSSRPRREESLSRSLIGLSGYPPRHLGWRWYRSLGAAALDLCAVAEGTLDGYIDCMHDAHGSWDYLGGLLVCAEAGAPVADAAGRDLVVREHSGRRTPVAAASRGTALRTSRRQGDLAPVASSSDVHERDRALRSSRRI